jgi:hypothetical protein
MGSAEEDEDDFSLSNASPRASFGSKICWQEELEEDCAYLLVRPGPSAEAFDLTTSLTIVAWV